MSGVTVVVPNWNRRDLLLELAGGLARPEPAGRGGPGGGQRIDGRIGGGGASRGGPRSPDGYKRRVQPRGELRDPRGSYPVAGDREQRRQTGPGLAGAVARAGSAGRCVVRDRQVAEAARPDRLDGTFDTICRGACAWRAGKGGRTARAGVSRGPSGWRR